MKLRLITLLAATTLALAACGGGGGESGPTVTVIDLPEKRSLLPSIAQADDTFVGTHHSGSGVCSDCHNDDSMTVPDVSGTPRNVSMGKAWRTSIMANGTRDPYWHAAVEIELDNYPMHEEAIMDKCTVCHAPMAHDMMFKEDRLSEFRLFDKGSEETGDFVQGFLSMDASNEVFNHAMDGISCSLCHQMDEANLGTVSSFSGGYEIADARNLLDKPAYGPYQNPDAAYMLQQTRNAEGQGFLAQAGPHMSTSETCATCHNLDVQSFDMQGDLEEFPSGHLFSEQANFTEWQFSDYAVGGPLEASCQDCHMPEVDYPVVLASGSSNPERENVSEHTFLGPNTVMQSMFRDFAEELGISADITEDDWNESIERNRAFLETSATLELGPVSRSALPVAEPAEGEPAPSPEEELAFDVTVVNETGHKLPTGYHSRRVWLHVLVTGDEGEVWESGAIRADGSIVGLSEDVNPKSHEVHYDLVTDPSQVQVWQAVTGNSDGERTGSLLNASNYIKDNRILPKGFDKAEVAALAASGQVAPTFGTFGAAVDDDDFDNGLDTVSYRVRVPAGGDYRVRVELRYQPMAYGHLQEMFARGDRLDRVDMFRTIYDATTLRFETIATATDEVAGN